MERKEKVQLLRDMLQGNKPEKRVCIVHTDTGLIIDPDNHKRLQPGEEEAYVQQIQKANPMFNVVYVNITVEDYKRIVEEIEKEI